MKKDDMVYLAHMLSYGRSVVDKVRELSWEDFEEDENLRLAVVHLIQFIGEAARYVSEETQKKHASIPWSDVIGMRHRIVHDYLNIKFRVAWKVAKEDLQPLIEELEKVIPPEE